MENTFGELGETEGYFEHNGKQNFVSCCFNKQLTFSKV